MQKFYKFEWSSRSTLIFTSKTPIYIEFEEMLVVSWSHRHRLHHKSLTGNWNLHFCFFVFFSSSKKILRIYRQLLADWKFSWKIFFVFSARSGEKRNFSTSFWSLCCHEGTMYKTDFWLYCRVKFCGCKEMMSVRVYTVYRYTLLVVGDTKRTT